MVRSAAAVCTVLILSGFALVQQVATHTVVDGDTLWDLAQSYYGDPFEWRLIWDANRETVANPNLILPGQVLNIPGRDAQVTDVAVQAPAAPSRAPAAPPRRRSMAEEPTVFYQDTTRMVAGVVRSGDVDYLAVPRDLVYSAPWLVGLEEEPEHLGNLIGFATGASISQTPRGYDRVRLSFDGATPRVGTQLQIFRVMKEIDNVALVVQPTGVVTVSDVGADGAVGIVTKEFERIQFNDFVGVLPTYALSGGQYAQAVQGDAHAMIMGFSGRAHLQDIGGVAFLDLGADDDIGVGDEFEYINDMAGEGVVEGRLQVVGVTPDGAAARIVDMDDVVFEQGLIVRLTRKMR